MQLFFCKAKVLKSIKIGAVILIISTVLFVLAIVFIQLKNAEHIEPLNPSGSDDEIIFAHTVSKTHFQIELFFSQEHYIFKLDLSAW